MTLPRIAITMGDPSGVGPEICLRALASREAAEVCVPIVFGDAAILARCAEATSLPAPRRVLRRDELNGADAPAVVDLGILSPDGFQPGRLGAEAGRAGYLYVERAIEAALAGEIDAVATAPLNKEAMSLAGFNYPGHTEIFAEKTGSTRWCMMQYSEEITCTFVTVHVGYRDVPLLITKERVLEVIELTAEGLERIRGRKPKIVVCGLNPHAGEHGLFGDREEERFIVPAIEAAQAAGHDVEGPLPPDTAFLPWKRKATDAFVCMYHDQGHIPVKALAFESAVNTTLGLPIVRTSVDHGTAFDIAWQGKAMPDSLFAALRLAAKLAKRR